MSRFLPPDAGRAALLGGARAVRRRRPAATRPSPTCCSSSGPRTMRSHAGQPAFPGGAVDPEDAARSPAALREAARGGRPRPGVGRRSSAPCPTCGCRRPGFVVTPVVAWWRAPHPVRRGRHRRGRRRRPGAARRGSPTPTTGCASRTRAAGSARRSRPATCSCGASPPACSTGCSRSAAGSGPGTPPARRSSRPRSSRWPAPARRRSRRRPSWPTRRRTTPSARAGPAPRSAP